MIWKAIPWALAWCVLSVALLLSWLFLPPRMHERWADNRRWCRYGYHTPEWSVPGMQECAACGAKRTANIGGCGPWHGGEA